jgi:hypothetical protein
VRKAASIRLGLLLAVSALLSCRSEKPDEKRCVDRDGQFVDEALCSSEGQPGMAPADGGVASGASGGWDTPAGGAQPPRSGYHFIWIPFGAFGAATSGAVNRGGFGATGATHAGAPSSSAASAGT